MSYPAPPAPPAASPPGHTGSIRSLTPRLRPRQPDSYIIDGPRLRQLRCEHGLSQERLAWESGVGLTTLARLERQARPRCRHWTLTRLALTLGEDPAAIRAAQSRREPPSNESTTKRS